MAQTGTDLITVEMVINDVIKHYPKVIGVFNQFNMDSCCGGADSIRVGAEKAGANPAEVVAALNAAARG